MLQSEYNVTIYINIQNYFFFLKFIIENKKKTETLIRS